MANHASAEKRNRQRVKREARNHSVKSEFRNLVKHVRELIAKGDVAGAKAALTPAISALDSAVTKGVLVRGTASRRVSRLAAAVHKLSITPVVAPTAKPAKAAKAAKPAKAAPAAAPAAKKPAAKKSAK